MRLHQLKPYHKKKSVKRTGRGGKRGTYSGRGNKGQKSRAGNKTRPGFSGGDTSLLKRLPKKRGSVGSVKIKKGVKPSQKTIILNLKDLEVKFSKNKGTSLISPKTLLEKGLIEKKRGRWPKIKILGQGQLKKEFKFEGVKLSKNINKKVKNKK